MSLDILWEECSAHDLPCYILTLQGSHPSKSIGLENYLLYSEYKDVDFFYQNELKLTSADIISYQKNTIMMETGTKNTLSSQIL